MNTNYEDRVTYRKGNVIGLNFASPRYEIEDYQRRNEGCERGEPCQVISLDDYRVERTSNDMYVKTTSLEKALQQTPLEQRRTRNGKNADKFTKGLLSKFSTSLSSNNETNIINLSRRGNRAQREYLMRRDIQEARKLGMFEDNFLDRREVLDYLTRQLRECYGFDLEPFQYLNTSELLYLGLNSQYYMNSLEARIEGGMH